MNSNLPHSRGGMTAAGLRVARERLGLTGETLSELLGVEWRTVRRWEAGTHPIPAGVEAQLGEWELEAGQLAAEMTADLAAGGELITYRSDEAFWEAEPERRPFPAAWHRAIVGRVKLDGIRVAYAE